MNYNTTHSKQSGWFLINFKLEEPSDLGLERMYLLKGIRESVDSLYIT